MTTKIGVYLTEDVAKRLKIAARRPGATKSGIVNKALLRHLDPAPEKEQGGEVLDRLKGLARRLRRIHREVEIVAETLGLFVRYFLMITPPLPKSEQHDAKILGHERYEVFVKQIAKRIASDSRLVAEVMGIVAETHPDRVTRSMANDAMPQGTSKVFDEASHG